MNIIVLIILVIVVLFVVFRFLVDLANDSTLTINELVELNINRLKNLFKLKK